MSEAKVRNASVSAEKFVTALVAGIVANQSNREIAESIGMTEGTFNVRKSNLVKSAEAKAASDPTYVNPFASLPKRTRKTSVSNALTMLSSVVAKLDKPADVAETVEVPASEETTETVAS